MGRVFVQRLCLWTLSLAQAKELGRVSRGKRHCPDDAIIDHRGAAGVPGCRIEQRIRLFQNETC